MFINLTNHLKLIITNIRMKTCFNNSTKSIWIIYKTILNMTISLTSHQCPIKIQITLQMQTMKTETTRATKDQEVESKITLIIINRIMMT